MSTISNLSGSLDSDSAARDVRVAARRGEWTGHTSGLANEYAQGNLVILPKEHASDFLRYCQANPKACPLLGVSEAGDPAIPSLGADLDIRTDLPRYRVWRDGVLTDEPTDISALWRDDLVSFVIGCSFTFEHALVADGIPLRHMQTGRGVSMWYTNIPTVRAGVFHGPLVVSMRPLRADQAIRAVQITSRYPAVHGAPVHLGNPALIGIEDIARPDVGDVMEIMDDELPVFWACGVTPQAALAAAKLPFAITHMPGAMLVTDLRHARLAAL